MGSTLAVHVGKYNDGITGPEIITVGADFDLDRAMELLDREQTLKLDAGICREKAVDIITPFHFTTGAREFSLPGKGRVAAFLGGRTTTDWNQAMLYLVEKGVSAGLVEKAKAAATKWVPNRNITVKWSRD